VTLVTAKAFEPPERSQAGNRPKVAER